MMSDKQDAKADDKGADASAAGAANERCGQPCPLHNKPCVGPKGHASTVHRCDDDGGWID